MSKNTIQKAEEFISLAQFRRFMYERILPLEELTDSKDVPLSKTFPYWRKHGLLPFIPKGQWVKLTFSQLIWVRMLDTLRTLGYSVEDTKNVCNYLFIDAYDSGLPEKNIKDNLQVFKKKKLAGTLSEEEHIMLDHIESIVNDKVLLGLLKYDINYLTNLITSSISMCEEAGILIFSDGEIGEHLGTEYFSHRSRNVDPTKPHIYLSITYFLKEFIDNDELHSIILSQLLNDNEKSVLKEVRNKNIDEIVIKRIGEDDLRIDSVRKGTLSGEQDKAIRRILGLRNYEEITLNTLDEKTLRFKRTKKQMKRSK